MVRVAGQTPPLALLQATGPTEFRTKPVTCLPRAQARVFCLYATKEFNDVPVAKPCFRGCASGSRSLLSSVNMTRLS